MPQSKLKTLFNAKLETYFSSENSPFSTLISPQYFTLMDPAAEVAYEIGSYVRVYKDGHAERHSEPEFIPPSIDPVNGVSSKDIIITPETNVSARIYLPHNTTTSEHKLPLLIYFHGSRFCIENPFSSMFHPYLSSIVSHSNVVAVSVNYRLAPEHPIPSAYDDAWAALQWVGAHSKGGDPEEWLNRYVNFGRVFLAGDSSGGNISHNTAIRAGCGGLMGLNIHGIALIHPTFWGKERIGSEAVHEDMAKADRAWAFASPSFPSNDDPRINPFVDGAPSLSGLGCSRVFICVAEKDILKDRGWLYYEKLRKSEWKGEVEIVETKGEGHIFHERNLNCEKAQDLIKCLASFFNS